MQQQNSMSRMVIKLGKGEKKPLLGMRKSSDVHSRHLGDERAPKQPSTSISTSHTTSKLQVKWPNKLKHFMRKRGVSSSTDHTGIDLFKQVSSNQSNEAIDGSNTELPGYFGMCGAAENMTYRPISPQEQQELLSQLDEYKQQIHLLSEELEEVNREIETAVERLDKLMKTNIMLNPVQLEDIKLMLSITEGMSTLSSQTIPFYTRMCSCVDVDN